MCVKKIYIIIIIYIMSYRIPSLTERANSTWELMEKRDAKHERKMAKFDDQVARERQNDAEMRKFKREQEYWDRLQKEELLRQMQAKKDAKIREDMENAEYIRNIKGEQESIAERKKYADVRDEIKRYNRGISPPRRYEEAKQMLDELKEKDAAVASYKTPTANNTGIWGFFQNVKNAASNAASNYPKGGKRNKSNNRKSRKQRKSRKHQQK